MNNIRRPFRWDEVRRAQLRAELDAHHARLYGPTRDELRYTLVRLHGEYRKRRLVLEEWDNLNAEGRMRNDE